MHVDHLIFAAGPDGISSVVDQLSEQLGERFRDGGFHPRFGTRNHILPLADRRYIEVVEVLDHPAADKAPFGQAVRARSEMGGGWLGWVVSVEDLKPYESRLDRDAVPASRQFPDGRRLEWKQIGIRDLIADPQLPYFLKWGSQPELLPSALGGDISVARIEMSGDRNRVEEWLGVEVGDSFDGIQLEWSAPNAYPGVNAVTFLTPNGPVRI